MLELIQDDAIWLWQGDAIAALKRLLEQGKTWDYCLTSPPYYRLINYGHPGQYGLEALIEEYLATMAEVFSLIYDGMNQKGVLWLNIANGKSNLSTIRSNGRRGDVHQRRQREPGHRQKELIRVASRLCDAVMEARPWVLMEEIIWDKGTDCQPQDGRTHQTHEYVFVLAKHNMIRPKPDYAPLSQSVIVCPPESHPDHPCKMPQDLADRLIGTATHPQATVIDPFIGTGTTAIATHRKGYSCIGIDLDISTAQKETAQLQGVLTL